MDIIETIAEYKSGFTDGYQKVIGITRRKWKTNKLWDSQPLVELCEWERDEYRFQAEKVLEFFSDEDDYEKNLIEDVKNIAKKGICKNIHLMKWLVDLLYYKNAKIKQLMSK